MGKDFNFYHTFETNFSEHNKIWGAQKRFGSNCPCVCGPGQNRRQKVFHWGPSWLCKGARHSENLFLIRNMNSSCSLCKLHHEYFTAYTHNVLVVSNQNFFNQLSKRNWVAYYSYFIVGDYLEM